MSEDLIRRSDAIKALKREKSDWNCDYNVPIDNCIKRLNKVKSADRPQDDEFKNFDRGDLIALIEAQKERIGELLADRPQGEWIYTDNPLRLDDEWACSRCGNISFAKTNYCDRCGCRMQKENE